MLQWLAGMSDFKFENGGVSCVNERRYLVLVTPEIDRRNRRQSLLTAALLAATGVFVGIWTSFLVGATLGIGSAYFAFHLMRRKCRRRLAAVRRAFPVIDEAILNTRVAFYQALNDAEKQRFRQLVQVFLDEVRITGVRVEIDETTRILVAASAVIPIFGFHDWDYHRLSEVLVYPTTFDQDYKIEGKSDRNILGLTGRGQLRGLLILSQPALLAGFSNASDRQNVGLHEFAHVVEQEEVQHGLPPEVPVDVIREWSAFVVRELKHPEINKAHINPYGYTNEHELLAVLTEYFFKSPESLRQRDPALYDLMRKLFHQDPASLLSQLQPRRRTGRNAPCPCGSGKKFKYCCGRVLEIQ
jgi:Mlc titration factor MtfA (ptsG expression regulator)